MNQPPLNNHIHCYQITQPPLNNYIHWYQINQPPLHNYIHCYQINQPPLNNYIHCYQINQPPLNNYIHCYQINQPPLNNYILSFYQSIYLSKDDRGITRRNMQVWEAYPTIARGNLAHNQTRRGDGGRWDQKTPMHIYIMCIRPNWLLSIRRVRSSSSSFTSPTQSS